MPKLLKKQEKSRKNDYVQSILVPRHYGLENVCPIMLTLGYNCFYIDETKNYYRVRQFNPGLHDNPKYRTESDVYFPRVKYVIEY